MLPTAKLRIIPAPDEEGSLVEKAVDAVVGAVASSVGNLSTPVGNLSFSDGFTVQINPESLSYSHHLDYAKDKVTGTSGSDNAYAGIKPSTLSFEIIFDRTGAVQSGDLLGNELSLLSGQGVDMDISNLKKVILNHEGKIHRPKKVKIVWGTAMQLPGQFSFKGQLTNFSYTYKKFNSFGLPLRASVSLTFEETVSDKERERMENNSSPDITHLITVKEGDTLPLLAHRVYGDSRYYIPVMHANNLVHFRNLKPGQKLIFPPIE